MASHCNYKAIHSSSIYLVVLHALVIVCMYTFSSFASDAPRIQNLWNKSILLQVTQTLTTAPWSHAQSESVIIVNSTDDPGVPGDTFITIREAISIATGKQTPQNAEMSLVSDSYGAATSDVIIFDPQIFPPQQPATIVLIDSELPQLDTGGDTLDGSNVGVILNGSSLSTGSGITIMSNDNVVQGMQILFFPEHGIQIRDSSNRNRIGGDRQSGAGPVGQGNVISGNGLCGIEIRGENVGITHTTIVGNLVGTNASGKSALGNGQFSESRFDAAGVHCTQSVTDTAILKNVVSGNGSYGIICITAVFPVTIKGNYVGTDITGEEAIGNGDFGIFLHEGDDMSPIQRGLIVGGPGLDEGNVVCGNGSDGIHIHESDGTIVQGNRVGTNYTGDIIPNAGHGIVLTVGTDGVIGGLAPGEGNIVWGNNHSGLDIAWVEDCLVAGNDIRFNQGYGIFLEGSIGDGERVRITENSITANVGDWDHSGAIPDWPRSFFTGGPGITFGHHPNRDLYAPTIGSVDSTSVVGRTSRIIPSGSLIEVFHDSGSQGETYLGSTTVESSQFIFEGNIPTSGNITCTVTDLDGNTSPFSRPFAVPEIEPTNTPVPEPAPTPTPTIQTGVSTWMHY